MVQVERSISVSASVDAVAEYLADFAHTEQWDPGTVSCKQVGAGAVSVDTQWHNVSEFRGKQTELTYRLTRLDPDRITFVGQNRTATSTDDFSLHAGPDGTVVRYQATIVFHGWAKLASPFLKREFERLGDEVVPKLTAQLEQLATG